MNVGQLKKKLENLPDNMIVVQPASDHTYSDIWCASKANAIDDGYSLSEDHDLKLEEYEERIEVFLIGGG